MKKTLITVLALSLVAGALLAAPADAKKRKKKVERTEEGTYNGGTGLAAFYPINHGGVQFETSSTERYVQVELTDATGMPIGFSVGQDPENDAQATVLGSACGKTTTPIAIQPGLEVTVFVGDLLTCPDPSPATTGTVKITFSNLP